MIKENIIKSLKVLRILILVALLILVFVLVTNKFYDCQVCKFKFEEQVIDELKLGGKDIYIDDLWLLYKKKCLTSFESLLGERIDFGNLTIP